MTDQSKRTALEFWIYSFGPEYIPDLTNVPRTRGEHLEGFYNYYNPAKEIWEAATEIHVREVTGEPTVSISEVLPLVAVASQAIRTLEKCARHFSYAQNELPIIKKSLADFQKLLEEKKK